MLTDAQGATLAAYIRASADAGVVAALAIRDDVSLTAWCNAAASPAQKAWRIAVPAADSDEAANWVAFDSLTQGKRDSFRQFLVFPRSFAKNTVRKWIRDVWGNVTAGSDAEALLLAGTENATNAQLAFGGAAVAEGTVSALKRNFTEQVSLTDVSVALNKNP